MSKKIALIAGISMAVASITGMLFFAHRCAKNANTYTEIGEWLLRYGKEDGLNNIFKLSKDELISERETAVNYLKQLEAINDDYAANVSLGVQVIILYIDAALGDLAEEKEA